MAQVRFALQGGGDVYVETKDTDRGGLIARDGVAEEAAQTFEEAVGHLRPIADALMAQVQGLLHAPDEVGLEFGITLKVEAGILIAKTAGEGNFKVSVKWKKD